MLVSISNFFTVLDARQLQKGKQYFEQDAVGYATQVKPGEWKAEVSGTDDYYITIKLDGDSVITTRCDCPHDDPFCKHVVAVLFFIQQQKGVSASKEAKAAPGSTRKKAAGKPASFETVLEKANEKELKEFLKTYAARNKEFRNLFLLRFELAGKEAGRQTFETLIRKTAALYMRGGFIDWDNNKKALQPALNILDEAEHNFEKEVFRVTFDAACAVVLEVPPLLQYMDDSDGLAGDCVERAFDVLHQLAESAAVPYVLKDEIFLFAQKEFSKPIYTDFGFDKVLLQLMIATAYEKDKQKLIFGIIDKRLQKTSTDYELRWLLDAKIELLQKCGRNTDVQAVLQDHITIAEYRERLIQHHIDNKNFDEAKKLAAEGVQGETFKQSWHRDKERWEAWLLKIALLQEDAPEIRKLGKSIYFGRSFDHRYYELCRKTFGEKEWQEECKSWIQWFLNKGQLSSLQLFALAQIYITERLYDRMLVLLQHNPDYEFAEFCKPYLQKRYELELLEIYRKSLIAFAANSNSRGQYIELRKRLKAIQQSSAGKDVANALIPFFLTQYKQRRAMKEELEKLII